jgi:putative flippase GtrA
MTLHIYKLEVLVPRSVGLYVTAIITYLSAMWGCLSLEEQLTSYNRRKLCYHMLTMIAYSRVKLRRLLRIEFIRFCIVGGTGFVINFILLFLLKDVLTIPVFIAQLLSAEAALFSNFKLHHHWTYKTHHVTKSGRSLLVQFHLTSWPAILGSALMVTAGETLLHLNNFAALIVSSVISLGWNFAWSKFVVWKDTTPEEIKEIAG